MGQVVRLDDRMWCHQARLPAIVFLGQCERNGLGVHTLIMHSRLVR